MNFSYFFKRYDLAIIGILIIVIGIAGVSLRYRKSMIEAEERSRVLQQVNLPKAELDLASYDFGTIPKTPPVEKLFTLFNRASSPLEVKNIVTSCGCTTAELVDELQGNKWKTILAPFSEIKVRVTFDPRAHASTGSVTRAVRIETNDPQNPFLIINLYANVQ